MQFLADDGGTFLWVEQKKHGKILCMFSFFWQQSAYCFDGIPWQTAGALKIKI